MRVMWAPPHLVTSRGSGGHETWRETWHETWGTVTPVSRINLYHRASVQHSHRFAHDNYLGTLYLQIPSTYLTKQHTKRRAKKTISIVHIKTELKYYMERTGLWRSVCAHAAIQQQYQQIECCCAVAVVVVETDCRITSHDSWPGVTNNGRSGTGAGRGAGRRFPPRIVLLDRIIWSLPLPLCRYEILLIWSTQHFYESKERNCPGEIKYRMDSKTITTPRTTRPPLLQRAAGTSPLQNIHVSAYFKCISNRKLSWDFYLSSSDILTEQCRVLCDCCL